MKFLIVDDSASQRVLIKFILQKAGYEEPKLAASGDEALGILGLGGVAEPATVDEIDLVLMDVHLGKTNGIDLCRTIKRSERGRDLPILFVTGSIAGEELEAGIAAGAFDFVMKPINKLELLSRVRAAVRLRKEFRLRRKQAMELARAKRQLQGIFEAVDSVVGPEGFASNLEAALEEVRSMRAGRCGQTLEQLGPRLGNVEAKLILLAPVIKCLREFQGIE